MTELGQEGMSGRHVEATSEPLAITREVQPAPVTQDTAPSEALKDAKVS